MDDKQIKNGFYSIGKTYPTFLALLMKDLPGQAGTVGNHWCSIIKQHNLDARHFDDVCYEYSTLERDIPEFLDQLPRAIIKETRRRMEADQRALEHHTEQVRYRLIKGGKDEARDWSPERIAEAWQDRQQN